MTRFNELKQFIQKGMRMEGPYQPVMIRTLLRQDGRARDGDIVRAFRAEPACRNASEDDLLRILNVQDKRRPTGPGAVLTRHKIVERDGAGYHLLGYDQLSRDQVAELIGLCEEGLADYRERNGRAETEAPEGTAPDPADDPDGEVWRGAAAFRGVVRNGVIVFDNPRVALADGTEVQVKVRPHEFTPEERAEFAGWEKLGDEAWAMIDEWEKEGPPRAAG